MVRLAHYPHNENMVRLADFTGLAGMVRNSGVLDDTIYQCRSIKKAKRNWQK